MPYNQTGNGIQPVIQVDATGVPLNDAAATGSASQSSTAASSVVQSQGRIWNGATWDRLNKPNAVSRLISAAASTNATVAKASAGDLFRVSLYNTNAAARYLKMYNKATAPTVGTDVPVWVEYLAPQSKTTIPFETPLYFSAGISYALTTGAADNDTGALTAGDVVALNIAYA